MKVSAVTQAEALCAAVGMMNKEVLGRAHGTEFVGTFVVELDVAEDPTSPSGERWTAEARPVQKNPGQPARPIAVPDRSITRGLYLHYKAEPYFVLGVGVLHDDDRRVVVYESTQSVTDGLLRLRFEDDFAAEVDPRSGKACRLGWACSAHQRHVPRFTRIEPGWKLGKVP